jgi:alkanesulfonate monooxygenase SsuD/methylene tetrahydromethanopterin reductase-like flavin-dependent oxidoreductase (luciferase family)
LIATIDQISQSRVVLNIVAGWNKPEYDTLGLDLPASHEERYGFAQEWCQIVRPLWAKTEAFDWDGKFWKLKNVLGMPRPAKMPTVLNAAGSGEGKDFATRNADLLFTIVFDPQKSKGEIEDLKVRARKNGREVAVLTTVYVVCRPTEQEANDYHAYYADQNADWEGADRLMSGIIAHSKTFPAEVQDKIRIGMAAGYGSWPVIGDPQQVADKLLMLHEAGFAGTTVSFVDYIKEFPYFRDEVMPLLVEAGIRKSGEKS